MTEELTPDFETFSQMLDLEDSGSIAKEFAEDAAILKGLAETLQEDAASSPLGEDFAKETEAQVKEWYALLPYSDKLLDTSRLYLLNRALAPRNLGIGAAVGGLGLLLGAASFKLLALYGTVLLLLSGGWLLKEQRLHLSKLGVQRVPSLLGDYIPGAAFYTLPILCVLLTGASAGGALKFLGTISVSFQGKQDVVQSLSIVVGIGVSLLLFRALLPFWRAYRARADKLVHLSVFEVAHALWLGTLGYGLAATTPILGNSVGRPEVFPVLVGGFCLVAIAVVHRFQRKEPHAEAPSFSFARKVFLSSVLLGFCPIALTLVLFYQVHLTREIDAPFYQIAVDQATDYLEKEKAIKPDQNGWVELRPFFIPEPQQSRDEVLVSKRLSALGSFYTEDDQSFQKMSSEQKMQYPEAKAEFLAELPRIEKALIKPHFSHVAVEGIGVRSLLPNFISYRAVSQGISLLTQEAIAKGEHEEALRLSLLGLRWATKEEAASLIQLMIQVAQLSITQDNLEALITSGALNNAQLTELEQALKNARYDERDFAESMSRETYLIDRAINELFIEGDASAADMVETGLPPILSLMPKSYWESERKAYWNFQLRRSESWYSLSLNETDFENEINPFNMASAAIAPNFARTQVQFCYINSRLSALSALCDIERYKLAHGEYPDPQHYLVKEIDLMDARPLTFKSTFAYKRTTNGYELISRSTSYSQINLEQTQVYGPKS